MESVRVRTRPCMCAADASAQIETQNPGQAKTHRPFFAESLTHAEQAVVTTSLCNHTKPLIRDSANESARWQRKQTREQPRDT